VRKQLDATIELAAEHAQPLLYRATLLPVPRRQAPRPQARPKTFKDAEPRLTSDRMERPLRDEASVAAAAAPLGAPGPAVKWQKKRLEHPDYANVKHYARSSA